MRQYLRAELQAMAEAQVAEMVNPRWLEGVRKEDPHPLIKAFAIGHEGDSDIVLGGRKAKVSWIRKAVEWIHEKLQMFIPVYDGHGAPGDNSPQGREPVGEIVGKKLAALGDKLTTIAAVYVYPQFRNKPFDVASIEADIEYEQDESSIRPTAVEKITGVALGSSLIMRPGFPGATLLGAVQAFAAQGEGHMPTLAEVREMVKQQGWKPTDLFAIDDVKADPKVEQFIKTEKHDVYQQNQRLQADLDAERDSKVKLTESYEGKLKEAKAAAVTGKRDVLVGEIAKERGYTDQQAAFVRLQMKRFQSSATDEGKLREDLNKFMDETQLDYAEIMKAHGIEIKKDAAGKDAGDKGKAGSEGKGGGSKSIADADMPEEMPYLNETNPDTNPLIPGGKADLEYAKSGKT